jgi:hydroxymethylglutaryl-CoA lyase
LISNIINSIFNNHYSFTGIIMQEVILHEVGMRDGLQVEKAIVPIEQKIIWIDKLIDSGIDIIQIGSFVHPDRVPQMADTDRLFSEYTSKQKSRAVIFSGLVLNEKGFERGLSCGVEMFCMGVSASDTHSQKNTGMTTAEATERIINIGKRAVQENKIIQVSVQSAFGCSFEGIVPEERVLRIVKQFLEAGFKKISLADTAGFADPWQTENLFESVIKLDKEVEYACHFHDTYGLGIANCYAALKVGVKYFESAFGGLGGCPFTAVTSGNVCSEDLINLMHKMNIRKDINNEKIIEVTKEAATFFKRDLPGIIYKK